MRYPVATHPLAVQPRSRGKWLIRNQDTGDQMLVNSSFAEIVSLCRGDKTVTDMTRLLSDQYAVPATEMRKSVDRALEIMGHWHMLDMAAEPRPSSVCVFNAPLRPPLRMAYLELTRRCNLNCLHCYNESGREAGTKSVDWLSVIGQLKEVGVLLLVLTGGEPLTFPGLLSLMRQAKAMGFALALFTNAYALTERRLAELRDCPPETICISLDGATAQTHNYLRNRDCFDRVVRHIRLAVEAGFRVRLDTILYRRNMHEAGDILHLASELRVAELRMETFNAIGNGARHVDLQVPLVAMPGIYASVSREASRLRTAGEYLPRLPFGDQTCLSRRSDETVAPYPVCGVGREMCLIKPNGDVVPCPMLYADEFVAGNAASESLRAIWTYSPVFLALRDHELGDIERCRTCAVRSRCGGGCRAKALLIHHSLRAPDDYKCYRHGVLGQA